MPLTSKERKRFEEIKDWCKRHIGGWVQWDMVRDLLAIVEALDKSDAPLTDAERHELSLLREGGDGLLTQREKFLIGVIDKLSAAPGGFTEQEKNAIERLLSYIWKWDIDLVINAAKRLAAPPEERDKQIMDRVMAEIAKVEARTRRSTMLEAAGRVCKDCANGRPVVLKPYGYAHTQVHINSDGGSREYTWGCSATPIHAALAKLDATAPSERKKGHSALRWNTQEQRLEKFDPHPAPGEDASERPKIVCLCGSTRFYEQFMEANYKETMAGKIVLSVGFFMHRKDTHHGQVVGCTPEQKIALDELHKRKIDLADEILVLNVGGYIGESTRSEINYAVAHNKIVRYLEVPAEASEEKQKGALDHLPGIDEFIEARKKQSDIGEAQPQPPQREAGRGASQ
jgi:hypothetical protein